MMTAFENHVDENFTAVPTNRSTPGPPPMSDECKLYSFVVYSVLLGSLSVFGSLGNILAYIVFWQDKIKTSTSFLFQGLALIDTALLVTAFPLYSIESFVAFTNWGHAFKIYAFPYVLVYVLPCAYFAQTATIWLTVLVCVNRFIAVCKPYQASRLCTVNQARKQLVGVLIFSLVYNIPRFLQATIDHFENENTTLPIPNGTTLGESRLYQIIYNNILYLIFLLILPLVILTGLNIRLIKALKEIRRRRAEMQSVRQQQDNNVTLVLIVVVLIFTICQAPPLVNQILWNVLDDSTRKCGGFQFYFQRICNMLVTLNSSVNFVIYFFFNTRFRQVLITTLCKREDKSVRSITNNTQYKDVEGTNESLL